MGSEFLNSSLVCRLCIKLSDLYHPIDYIRKPLESILPNLDLSLTNDPVVVCLNCVTMAIQCHTFITTCLEKNKKIQDHHNKMNIKIVDLDSLVKNSKDPIEAVKVENTCDGIIGYTVNVEKNDQNKLLPEKEYQDLLAKSASKNGNNVHQESETNKIIEIFESDIFSDGDLDISEVTPLGENACHKIVVPAKKRQTEKNKENDYMVVTDSENEFGDTENDNRGVVNKLNQTSSQPLDTNLLVALKSQQKSLKKRKKTGTKPQCLICHKMFAHKQHLNGHLISKHKDIPDIENIVGSKIHHCPKCTFKSIRNYEVAAHEKRCHKKIKTLPT